MRLFFWYDRASSNGPFPPDAKALISPSLKIPLPVLESITWAERLHYYCFLTVLWHITFFLLSLRVVYDMWSIRKLTVCTNTVQVLLCVQIAEKCQHFPVVVWVLVSEKSWAIATPLSLTGENWVTVNSRNQAPKENIFLSNPPEASEEMAVRVQWVSGQCSWSYDLGSGSTAKSRELDSMILRGSFQPETGILWFCDLNAKNHNLPQKQPQNPNNPKTQTPNKKKIFISASDKFLCSDRYQLEPDRNTEFPEFMMGGCCEFPFALVPIRHHWAQCHAAFRCSWEVCCVPDTSACETWCVGSVMWTGTETPNCYGEKGQQWAWIPFGLL